MPEFEYTYKCVADDITDFPFHEIVPATLAPGEKAVSARQIKHPHLKLVSRRVLSKPKAEKAPKAPQAPRRPKQEPPETTTQPGPEVSPPAPREIPAGAPREVA